MHHSTKYNWSFQFVNVMERTINSLMPLSKRSMHGSNELSTCGRLMKQENNVILFGHFLLKSTFAFIRSTQKTTSQSLLCSSACSIQNLLNLKKKILVLRSRIEREVLLFRIKREVPVAWLVETEHIWGLFGKLRIAEGNIATFEVHTPWGWHERWSHLAYYACYQGKNTATHS